jgi:4a-hydroxytetrahydrobiopterin dehydratase
MAVLNELELSEAVTSLGNGWEVRDGALRKRYEVADFAAAMALANRIADAAEHADHHPDMVVGWGRLELAWATHSEGGITDRDVAMARRSDELARDA